MAKEPISARLEKDLLVWDVYTYRIEKIEK